MFNNSEFIIIRRMIAVILIVTLALGPQFSYAQSAFVATLPEPGQMVGRSPAFVPVLVKGLVIHPDKPLNFDFIVDSGNDSAGQVAVKEQSEKIVKYFLAALTVPEKSLWVNLSPYEKDRMIDESLGQTVLGRDMLAQDYVLKQVTASLIYPEDNLGKEFWNRIYKEAQEKFGTTDIPVDTFNKVWITPEKAEVFEKDNAVYVTQAKLKVMLDSDYLAAQGSGNGELAVSLPAVGRDQGRGDSKAEFTKNIIRQVVLPAIEEEVNQGKNFAALRQVYCAAILAKWYRELVQDTLMSQGYVGKNKISGVSSDDKTLKEQIYQRYIAAYKQGVFNYIKEEANALTGETTPRKYFSGGLYKFGDIKLDKAQGPEAVVKVGKVFEVDFAMDGAKDASMVNVTPAEALAYQEEMRRNFVELDKKAALQFGDTTSSQAVVDAISHNNGNRESMFHHILVAGNQDVRRIYKAVQDLVKENVGKDTPVINMSLDELHVTISNDEIAPMGALTLSLQELTDALRQDNGDLRPFDIALVGPHLMPNGVVVMEYTTSAPAFLQLRKAALARYKAHPLSEDNRDFVPNIMHSTVAVIRDPQIPRQALQALKVKLDDYRSKLQPVHITVNTITATHFLEESRRFVASLDMGLSVVDASRDDLQQISSALSEQADPAMNGGIDIKNIDVNKTGHGRIKFNDATLQQIFNGGFDGFTPVFIKMTPVNDPLMLLGVAPAAPKEVKV